jgi:drug/metabolite transporter (DMT)-like permease
MNVRKYYIYLILFLVMVAWGLNVVAMKVLVTAFPPVTLSAVRLFTASIAVFTILSLFKMVRLPSKKEWTYVLLGTLFNVVGHQYFIAVGLTNTTATNGGLILGLSPLLTTLFAIMFLKNRLSLVKILGILLGLTGVIFIVLSNGSLSNISIGDLQVFISVICIAISFILIKKVSNTLDPRLLTAYMLLIGSSILFILGLQLEPGAIQIIGKASTNMWMIFFASAIFSTALGHMFYNFAIGKVGAAEAAIFTNLNPFFAGVGAVILLGESISIHQVIGFILIMSGVLFGSGAYEEMKKNRKKRQEAKTA